MGVHGHFWEGLLLGRLMVFVSCTGVKESLEESGRFGLFFKFCLFLVGGGGATVAHELRDDDEYGYRYQQCRELTKY